MKRMLRSLEEGETEEKDIAGLIAGASLVFQNINLSRTRSSGLQAGEYYLYHCHVGL